MNSLKTTVVLVLLLILTMATSLVALQGQGQTKKSTAPSNGPPAAGQSAENPREHFPAVDFDAPEPTDPKIRAERMKKSSRYDKKRFVSKRSATHITSSSRLIEDYYVPAIPAEQSSVIIIGDVMDAAAHLSNDKSGIYSEFTVQVSDVLKSGGTSPLAQGDKVIVEREGGIVRYPDGHERLYQLMGHGMPRVGGKYVFFLSTVEGEQTYNLLTGYELLAGSVAPLDSSNQFSEYAGYDTIAFLDLIRTSIAKGR